MEQQNWKTNKNLVKREAKNLRPYQTSISINSFKGLAREPEQIKPDYILRKDSNWVEPHGDGVLRQPSTERMNSTQVNLKSHFD